MKLLVTTLAIGLLGAGTANASVCDPNDVYFHHRNMCGDALLKAGWELVARCHDGHSWAYVLGKDDERLLCHGINGYAGPTEFPCRSFRGDINRFRLIAARLPATSRGAFVRAADSCMTAGDPTYGRVQ